MNDNIKIITKISLSVMAVSFFMLVISQLFDTLDFFLMFLPIFKISLAICVILGVIRFILWYKDVC